MNAMALPQDPSNFDILLEVTRVKDIAEETRRLARRTNGRVTKLEAWKQAVDAVDLYKSNKRKSPQDYMKQVLVILAATVTIIGLLVRFVIGDL